MTEVIHGVGILMNLLGFAIFARAILSWFPIDRNGPVVQLLNSVTDPILEPIRRVVPPIGMIDLTPMLAIFVLFIVGGILTGYQPA